LETTSALKLTLGQMGEEGKDRRLLTYEGRGNPLTGTVSFDKRTGKQTTTAPVPKPVDPNAPKKAGDELEEANPASIEKWADAWAMTGVPPKIGARALSKYSGAIINKVTEKYPDFDLASGQANFGANVTAKNVLTKNRSLIASFEAAAQRNMKMIEDGLSKLPESGVPMLNKPLREFQARVMGNEDVAVFHSNMEIVKREAARILSTANASGSSQISDSDRKELASVVDNTATVGQLKRVFAMLRQDFNNRIGAIDAEIAGIDKRIGTHPDGKSSQPKKSREELLKEYGGK
jgi:hypothetical protein